jgi:flagellin-like protein
MSGKTTAEKHVQARGFPQTSDGRPPLRTADRGVSPVIGAILMFALALALLAILQTTAVPALNEQAEFQHNQQTQDEMADLEAVMERVVATGSDETASITAGLRYPPRMFFINPPPATGTVRTTDNATIEIDNARATGETADYWDGSAKLFGTRSVVYRPNYNEYANAPVTVVEPWVVYNRFEQERLVATEQDIVDGRRLALTALRGDRSMSRTGRLPLRVEPTSAPAKTVRVRGDGDPVTVRIPTQLSENDWTDLLADELDPASDPDNDRYVTSIDCQQAPPAPCGQLTLTFEPDATYELRLAAVAVTSTVPEPPTTYLTDVSGNATAVPESGSQKLVVEARDSFDNPVSGVPITGSVSGDGSLRPVDSTTGIDGRSAFVYEPPDAVDESKNVTVTLAFGEGRQPEQESSFTLRVMDIDGSGTGGVGTAPNATITTVDANTAGAQDRYRTSVDTTDSDSDLDRVEFELRDADTETVIDSAIASVAGGSDSATERLVASGGDQADEYQIVVTAVDRADNTGSDERTVRP